jgi:hypothetical protein
MLARLRPHRRLKPAPWHAAFLSMVPAIVRHAKIAFRHCDRERREDLIQEAVANALVAFARLVQLKKADLAYPSVLAKYAVARINDGRRVGNRSNIREVLSAYAQQHKGFHVDRLDQFDDEENAWQEAVVVDTRTAPVLDTVAFRCDFAEWLASLRRRDRRIAESLAIGNRTSEAARKFGVCEGRISQLRRELAESWRKFVGEEPDAIAA